MSENLGIKGLKVAKVWEDVDGNTQELIQAAVLSFVNDLTVSH